MEAAAADLGSSPDQLIAALSCPSSHAGLYSRFTKYLQPFSSHLPTRRNPKPKQNKRPPSDAASVRPLAVRFLPFLNRAVKLLPPLLLTNLSSCDDGCPDELIEIYSLLLDCLEVLSECIAGSPYLVLIERGHFVCCLESRAHYARGVAAATAALDALRSKHSPPTTTAKSRRGGASVADPGIDPEASLLMAKLTISLAKCASKGKVKEAAPYERVLSLVKQRLRIQAEEVSKKHLSLLANALRSCAIFLAAECSFFSASLVCEFCVAQMVERFPEPQVARDICSSVDLSWSGSTRLLLDVLNTVLELSLCAKAELPKAVNEFMVFVAYFSRSFSSSNRDVSVGASELLYKQGGYFSEVSSPVPSILHLYATGLHLSSQQIQSEEHPCMSLDSPNNEKYLRTLNNALGTLARFFRAANGKSISFDSLGNDSSSLMQPVDSNKHSYSQSHKHIYFMAYMDSLEFVCNILLQHTNAVWKNFSEGKALQYSESLTYVLTALHQFTDSGLAACSCTIRSEEDRKRLHKQRATLLASLVSAIKISFATNNAIKKSLYSIDCAISSTWLMLGDFKFLMVSLVNIGLTLYNIGHFEEASKTLELCCQTIWAYAKLCYQRLSAKRKGAALLRIYQRIR